MLRREDQDFLSSVGTRLRSPRRPSGAGEIVRRVNWLLIAGFVVVMAACLYLCRFDAFSRWVPFVFVVVGWVFSLTLHEFGHAAAAFLSGDRSDSTRRYLSANPIHYLHPFLSIIFPLLFVLIGGIGLPGGAVYLQRQLVRGRWRHTAISLAGPLGNLVVLLLLVALFHFGDAFGFLSIAALGAVAFLAFLQISAILLNLIPIPPLDGYGAIEPYLSYETRRTFDAIRPYGFFIIILLFLIPTINVFFFSLVDKGLSLTGIDPLFSDLGYAEFFFWRQ
jgi:Zn-dependent protease